MLTSLGTLEGNMQGFQSTVAAASGAMTWWVGSSR